jgi:hypothetical protein
MKKIVYLLLFVFFITRLPAQNFTGQWRGEFVDNSTAFTGWGGDRCEYVLEIECKGTKVTGYSYTYFSDAGKRYYTICKLSGTLNKAGKYLEVIEIERTKTNVPVNIRNCFQIHRLNYSKEGDEQKLAGTWIPVPKQDGDCGFGSTVLSRRLLQKNPAYYNNTVTKPTPKKTTPVVKTKPVQTNPPVVNNTQKKTTSTPEVKTKPGQTKPKSVVKTTPKKAAEPAVVKAEPGIKLNTDSLSPDRKKSDLTTNNLPVPQSIQTEVVEKKNAETRYEKRNSDVIKTIEIDNASFTVDLYDNGEIDGDSISLFFNGKLILSHKRLSDKALRLKLDVDENRDVNELNMYAENLGIIPPNTALMVVNDGDNRYEVRISSDLQKSGVIRFVHKLKSKQ